MLGERTTRQKTWFLGKHKRYSWKTKMARSNGYSRYGLFRGFATEYAFHIESWLDMAKVVIGQICYCVDNKWPICCQFDFGH